MLFRTGQYEDIMTRPLITDSKRQNNFAFNLSYANVVKFPVTALMGKTINYEFLCVLKAGWCTKE